MRSPLLLGTALSLIIGSASAEAQDAVATTATPAASPQTSADTQGLADIVVTAQRRTESAQRAGIAIDVVSAAQVLAQGISQPSDLNRIVPSLQVQDAGGANKTFFLRGVGNFTVNGYSDPAIAVNYDGVYLGRPTSTSGLFYDLERIEVLKGPQGTLYGRNATAGAINVLPARPKLDALSGFVDASYGNYNAVNVQGAINVPLSSIAAIRVSGNVVSRDGYLSDGTSDEKTQAARIQLLVQPSSDLSFRLAADWSHSGGKGVGASYDGSYTRNFATGKYNFVPSGLDASIGLLDPRSQAYRQTLFLGVSGRTAAPLDDNVYLDNRFYGVNGELTWDTSAGTLTVLPAYRRSDLNYKFGTAAFVGLIREKDEQYSLEARFNGKRIGAFDYVLGAYYFDEKVNGNYTFAQQALNAYQFFSSSTKSWALFGRVVANVTDRFRLIGGVRYTDDHKDFNGQADVFVVVCTRRNAFGVPSCPTTPLLPVGTDYNALQPPFIVPPPGQARPIGATGAILSRVTTIVDATQPTSQVTWRGAAEFDLAPQSLAYASVEKGYRSGGFSLAAGYETYKPEFITAYTVGVKNRFFDNQLQLNVEAFWWDYTDQQIGRIGVDANGNQGQFSQNIGQSTIKGVEANVEYLPLPDTLLTGEVQYLDSRYKSFSYTQPLGNSPPLTGCPTTLNAGIYTINCSGFPAFNAPNWTLTLAAQQTVRFGGYKLVGSVDTQYRSSRFVEAEFLPEELVHGTWTTNVQLGFGPDGGRWQLTGFIRNLENDRIIVNTPTISVANALVETTSAPRTFGVRVGYKF